MNKLKADIFIWRVSIALLSCLALLLPKVANGAITSPYIVDEKPRVLFSDSIEVNDATGYHYGLENYKNDYVNGYLHVTFTYTHHFCCYDNFPPGFYITDKDPRNTTDINVKSLTTMYLLYTAHPTGWYTYEAQFDATGYKRIVKLSGTTEIVNNHVDINNLSDTDWVGFLNSFLLSENNQPNDYSMSFTPIPIKEGAVTPTKTPVIIVPGIMGSYLNKEDGTEAWMNLLKMALPGDDSYLDDLKADSGIKITSTAIIDKIQNFDIFNGLIARLSSKEVINYPYDWRLELSESVKNLREKILKTHQATNGTVDIVAHSMGGLLVKEYLKEYGGEYVNKFIDIGTPHLGSVKSFKILSYGDNMGFEKIGLSILNPNRTKEISQNMPSVYELLPSRLYVSSNGNYLYDMDDLDQNGTRGSLDYEETKKFMKNTGINTSLLDAADLLHQSLDNLNPADYGVDTYNIVGCGTETLGKVFVLNKESSGNIEYNISFTNGDGTVPIKSALALPANKTFYAHNAVHATLPSTDGVKELITSILEDKEITPSTNISTSLGNCQIPNGKIVSFHSPVDLHIYDQNGNHTGPNPEGDIEQGISGVSYEIFDGNKFAYIPEGDNYRIEGKATGLGTFNVRIETIQNENLMETQYYNAIPLTSSTQVEVKEGSIIIDDNRDGIYEGEVTPSSILDESQSQDVIKPTTLIVLTGNKQKGGSYASSVNVKLSATDDNSGILKTEYSLDNGAKWNTYTLPFAVNTKGVNNLLYKSTDRAGNVEILKAATININKK